MIINWVREKAKDVKLDSASNTTANAVKSDKSKSSRSGSKSNVNSSSKSGSDSRPGSGSGRSS